MRTLIALVASLAFSLSACVLQDSFIEQGMTSDEISRMKVAYQVCQKDLESRYGVDAGYNFLGFSGMSTDDNSPWLYDCMKSKGYGYRPRP